MTDQNLRGVILDEKSGKDGLHYYLVEIVLENGQPYGVWVVETYSADKQHQTNLESYRSRPGAKMVFDYKR